MHLIAWVAGIMMVCLHASGKRLYAGRPEGVPVTGQTGTHLQDCQPLPALPTTDAVPYTAPAACCDKGVHSRAQQAKLRMQNFVLRQLILRVGSLQLHGVDDWYFKSTPNRASPAVKHRPLCC